jgi:hypothetical protein
MESHNRSEKEPFHQQQDIYESGGEGPDTDRHQQRRRQRGQLQREDSGVRETSQSHDVGPLAGNEADTQQHRGEGRDDALRLRLDLNLDVEITLKARIHGDLELALL